MSLLDSLEDKEFISEVGIVDPWMNSESSDRERELELSFFIKPREISSSSFEDILSDTSKL